MGGFTSTPPVLAGKSVGAVTFLHESNLLPGRANRLLAHFVDECFVGFPESVGRLWNPRVTHTGTPVRPTIEPQETMGGSQGASGLNELVLSALPALASGMPDLQFLHLSGERDLNMVRAAHAPLGRRSVVRAFFSEIEFALGAATLVVSRSGASTLAEIAAMRLPSILVPFPHAADNHQYLNAAAFANSGAALLLEQSTPPPVFAREVLRLATNPLRRESMGVALEHWHSPDAPARIARRVVQVASMHHPQCHLASALSNDSPLPAAARSAAPSNHCLTR
jgi:UDP-N-acetylglucosamine--N-acetylmuramyl-(pentapeptide) pyrophosphoryl-undecaprenol N-acetylglucosamine transferase